MSEINNTTNDAEVKPNTGSNSEGAYISECREQAVEAVKHFGSTKLANDKDKLGMRACYLVVYQDDDYTREQVVKYLNAQTKNGSKLAKEQASKWLHSEFELVKPKKGAMGDHVTKYNNSLAAVRRSLSDIRSVYERGIRVVREGKEVKVTAATYSKVMDAATKTNVPITMMNSKNSVTFNGLVIRKTVPKKAGSEVKTLTATAANVSAACELARVSIEQCSVEKLDGTQRISILNVLFAAQLILGAEHDKKLLAEYETLKNDPARKAS